MVYPLGDLWEDEEEKTAAAKRVLELSDAQIWELFEKVGISWDASREEIVQEIRDKRLESMNLDILLTESDSKENLLKQVSELEDQQN